MNGDSATIEAAVKRGMIAIADEVDGIHDEHRKAMELVEARMREQFGDIKTQVAAIQKTLYAIGTTIVTILIGSSITVFFTR